MDIIGKGKEGSVSFHILDIEYCRILFVVYLWMVAWWFSIIFGQFISYYIYLWNLNEKGIWNKLHGALKTLLVITPVIAAAFMLHDAQHFIDSFSAMKKYLFGYWFSVQWGKLFSLSALYINGLIHSIIKSLYCLPASGLSAWSVHRLLWHTVYSVLILCWFWVNPSDSLPISQSDDWT